MSKILKRRPGSPCCGCFDYYAAFPDHPWINEPDRNWADHMIEEGPGVWSTKKDLPAFNYYLDLRDFVPTEFWLADNSPAEFLVEWIDNADQVHYWVKHYLRAEPLEITGPDQTGTYRAEKIVTLIAETPDVKIVERSYDSIGLASPSGGFLAYFYHGRFGPEYTYEDWVAQLEETPVELPGDSYYGGAGSITVREGNLSIENLLSSGVYKDGEPEKRFGVPGYPIKGVDLPSGLRIRLTMTGTQELGPHYFGAKQLADPVNGRNVNCDRYPCYFISPYHAQEWAEPSIDWSGAVELGGDVFQTLGPPAFSYFGCGGAFARKPTFEPSAHADQFELGPSSVYTHLGSLKAGYGATVTPVGDEFYSINQFGKPAEGKIRIYVALSINFETPSFDPALFDDPTSFELPSVFGTTKTHTIGSNETEWGYCFLSWIFDVDRWEGDNRPSFTLNAADSEEAEAGLSLTRYAYRDCTMRRANFGNYRYQWTTHELDFSTLSISF